jgi:hypothetical protein
MIRSGSAALAATRARRALAMDAGLALVLGGLAAGFSPHPGPGGYALVALAAAGQVARRVKPVIACAVTHAAIIGYFALGHGFGPIVLLGALGLYSVTVGSKEWPAALAGILAVAAYVPLGAWRPGLAAEWTPLWVVAPVLAGHLVGRYRRSALRHERLRTGRALPARVRRAVTRRHATPDPPAAPPVAISPDAVERG